MFYKSIEAPGKRASRPFPSDSVNAGSWLSKKILCIILPNWRTVTSDSLSCVLCSIMTTARASSLFLSSWCLLTVTVPWNEYNSAVWNRVRLLYSLVLKGHCHDLDMRSRVINFYCAHSSHHERQPYWIYQVRRNLAQIIANIEVFFCLRVWGHRRSLGSSRLVRWHMEAQEPSVVREVCSFTLIAYFFSFNLIGGWCILFL